MTISELTWLVGMLLAVSCFAASGFFIYLSWYSGPATALLPIAAGFLVVGNYCLFRLDSPIGW